MPFKTLWLRLALGVLCVAGLAAGAAPASAQELQRGLVTANKLSLGASVGYAFRVSDDGDLDDDANPYGVGLGLRGGYTLGGGLYLGGLFNYFLGESAGGDVVNGRVNQMNIAGEAGFDIALGERAVLRPVVGLGASIAMGEICVLDSCAEDQTDPYLLIAPGVDVVIALGENFYLGGEARYFYLPDDEFPDGLLLAANIGALL